MLLNEFINEAYTPVNKKIMKTFGVIAAVYLGELIRQRTFFGNEEFFFSQPDMEEEIGLSEYDQRTSLKMLVDVNFVTVEKKGVPAKYYFKINDYVIIEWLKSQSFKFGSTSTPNFEAQALENSDHSYNKNIIKKEIKNLDNKKNSRIKKKKEQEEITIPKRDELYSFIGESRGCEKFCDILEECNVQQSLTLEQAKEIYDWMVGFFLEKYEGKFYRDGNGNYVGVDIVFDELDKFISYFSEHREKPILNLKSRLRVWITHSVAYNQKK